MVKVNAKGEQRGRRRFLAGTVLMQWKGRVRDWRWLLVDNEKLEEDAKCKEGKVGGSVRQEQEMPRYVRIGESVHTAKEEALPELGKGGVSAKEPHL